MAAEQLDDLVVRPATPDDLAGIAELFLATRSAAVPAMPPIVGSEDGFREFVRSWDLSDPPRREVWVAGDDLDLVGFAVLKADWLDSLYVGPQQQGIGVGSMLLDLAKARRPDGFALWVFAGNAPARGFYHRHGLVELEHTDGSGNEERTPDVRMAWPGNNPLAYLRGEVDATDAELAEVLARRFALTVAIQGHKHGAGLGGGHAGRDPEREHEIVERMAQHVPGLPPERIAPIMNVVISEGLSAWESTR